MLAHFDQGHSISVDPQAYDEVKRCAHGTSDEVACARTISWRPEIQQYAQGTILPLCRTYHQVREILL